MNVIPHWVRPGDTVLIIATARKISKEEITPAIHTLESWGLRVVESPHLYASCNQFAGTDAERAHDLQWALDHPSASAIFIARGGYGTLKIIDKVTFSGFRRHPKWVTGFSDVTVLHSHMNTLGFASLHSPVPLTFNRSESSNLSLKDLLFGKQVPYKIACHPLNRSGDAKGTVKGGNLSLLYALSGSVSDIDCADCILFIEDLDEYLYHIDRMMMQLKRSGKLSKLAGIIVGGMNDMKDNTIAFGKNAEEIIREAVDEFNYPVCFGFPAGHDTVNMALYLGMSARLKVGADHVEFKYADVPDDLR
jgi:muramoyltetrapeptide carboxypeptidase